MACNTYSKLCSVVMILFLHGVHSAASEGCASLSPRWRDLGGDFCYIIEEYDTRSWIDAVYQCSSAGGSLASFHSEDDVQRVINNIQNTTKRFYIGLWKNNDGSLEWVDKSDMLFTNWYPGEPNLYFEKCTELYADNGKWNDVACAEEFGYVCSSPKTRSSTMLSPKTVCPAASAEWLDFDGESCYIIEEENKVTSSDALARCTEAGGSLASFHSLEEVSTVLQEIKPYNQGFHIGLRLNDEGKYNWVDGSPLDLDYFDIWSLAGDDNQCVYMFSENGQWFDASCTKVTGYICSAPKVATCVHHLAEERGAIHSPNYPQHYGPDEKCIWYITAAEDSSLFLDFQDFQVTSVFNCEDFVAVLDGHEETSPILGKYCGYGIPESIRSSGNKMTVIFSSNAFMEDYGFYARYESGKCGGVIAGDNGMIISPHYPQTYRANENCTWEVTAPENHLIFLWFEAFELEGSYDCRYDSVLIRDGLEADDPVLGKFCGSTIPSTVSSSSNTITVTFVTDGSDERTGFLAKFQSKDISNFVGMESVFEEMFPLILMEKIQGAKERLSYKTDQESEGKKHPEQLQAGSKKATEVVIQQL